jgi:integrase/recombinase XerC
MWAHLFRHSWAHYFREGGGEEGDLKVLGGWESDEMVRWYGSSQAAARARKASVEHSVADRLLGDKGRKRNR